MLRDYVRVGVERDLDAVSGLEFTHKFKGQIQGKVATTGKGVEEGRNQ